MNRDIIPTIKNRIADIMIAKGLKKYTLAEKAGISHPTIQNWYSTREYDPSFDSMIKVSDALEISLSQLFLSEDEEMYPVDKKLREFLEDYLTLDEDDKEIIHKIVKKLKRS